MAESSVLMKKFVLKLVSLWYWICECYPAFIIKWRQRKTFYEIVGFEWGNGCELNRNDEFFQ